MSDQTTDPVDDKLEQAFDQIESRQTKAETPRQEPASGRIGSLLSIVLALIAIGIASWPAYEIYREKQTSPSAQVAPDETRLLQVETGVGQLGDQLRQLEGGLDALGERLTTSETQTQSFQTGVSESMESIRNRMGTSSQDWVYAEVEYLIRMANQRVLIEQDATSAIQLLQSADAIIRETDGLTAHGLREALARDIGALKAVNSPDTQGIYLELSAMISQVAALRRTLPVYQAPEPGPNDSDEVTGYVARITALIRQAGSELAHLVDFRRGEVEVKRILPPNEEYFLRQNLVLKLQIAQMALLEGNGKVFQSALQEARQWVSDSFDEGNPGTAAMLESITRLSAAEVTVELPDISGSQKAARSQLSGFREAQPK